MIRRTSIVRKKDKCLDCPSVTYLTAGRCQYCYKKHRAKENADKRLARGITQTTKPHKKMTSKIQPKVEDKELSSFFEYAENLVARRPRCMECGAHIHLMYYRHAVAHIFPKSIFHSVRAHPEIFLVLGAACGCHDKSHRIDTFSKMKVWPLAVQKFMKFRDQITENHKLLSTFEEAAEPIIHQLTSKV